ncbi:hypothetical protein M3Y95_00638100 [Aphelenchoides besseyi]|nr:hypothetical protein M3Y95_00638100 [Aphelenchoides besseyi]
MTLIAIFVLLLSSTVVKSEDEKVFRVQLFTNIESAVPNPIVFNIALGNQNFSLFPFSMTTELIVVDKECGTPLSRCPLLCQRPELQFYCDVSCTTNRLNHPIVCGEPNQQEYSYYDPKISSTFRSLDDKEHGRWYGQFQNTRPMIGKFGIENLVVQTKDNAAAMKVEGFEFVHAFSMDTS